MYDCIMYSVCACVCKWVCMHAWSYWPQHAAAYFLRVAACPGEMSWPGLHALADSSKNRRTSTLAYWAATINTLSPFWLWRLKSLGPWRSYYWEHIISLSLSLSLSLSPPPSLPAISSWSPSEAVCSAGQTLFFFSFVFCWSRWETVSQQSLVCWWVGHCCQEE